MASVFCCGFECGVTAAHWTLGATASFSTSTVRSGSRALRCNPSAVSTGNATSVITSTSGIWTIRAYIYFTSFGVFESRLIGFDLGGFQYGLWFSGVNGGLYVQAGIFQSKYYKVVTGRWYQIDLRINTSANPHVVDGIIDGHVFQATRAIAADNTSVAVILGASTNSTYDIFFDDVIISNTAADYPFGPGYVNHFVPTADGTHNVAGTNDFEVGTGGTDINNATTTAWQLLDDIPMQTGAPGTTDFINLIAPPNATDYVEVVYGPASGISTPTIAPRAVDVLVGTSASATGTNNIRLALNDNGTTDDVVNGSLHGASTNIIISRKHYTDPPSAASTWTLSGNGNFNNLRMRCLTSDAAPDPYFTGTMIEAEFASPPLNQRRVTSIGHPFMI